MKRTSKLISLLLSIAMLCSLFVPAMAADEKKDGPAPYAIGDVKGKLVILHTNDTHGADMTYHKGIDPEYKELSESFGTAGVAQLKKDFIAAGADVLLLSAGDAIQGSPLVSVSKGATAFAYMNAAGYDAMTVGNHEMDYGYDNLKTLVKTAKFPVLAANVLDASTKQPTMEANKLFTTASGLKVGVFGLATPETLTKADPSKMKAITFPQNPQELYDVAQAQVTALTKAGAEYIICLGHLGVDEGSAGYRSNDVCNHVKGIDLFVDGHSHTVMKDGAPVSKDKKVNTYPTFENKSETLIVSTGNSLANVGVVVYDKTAKTTTSHLIPAATYTAADPALKATIKTEYDKLKGELGVAFADTAVVLDGGRDPGNRTQETNLGDYATDALLWAARKNFGADKIDAALTNGGGIRETIKVGKLSMWDCKTVFPFGNVVATVELTGAQLLEALEAAAQDCPKANGGFAQVSGISYTINTAVPYEKGELYAASTFAAPAKPGSRVTIDTVNGKPFDLKATYTIATNDFTANGGDTYCVFKETKNLKMTSIAMEDALVDYTREVLKNKITVEQYGKPQGRINVLSEDIVVGSWYEKAAHTMLINGTMAGVGKNRFNAGGTVTRGTIYQMLFNMEGKPAGSKASAFTDIEGMWYAPAVNWAVSAKLLDDTDKTFGEEVITRGELATILAGYAYYKGIEVATEGMAMKEAPDYATISAEDLPGMTFCFYGKVMVGDGAGNLNSKGSLTRGELAQAMCNFAKLPVLYTIEKVEIDVPASGKIPAHKMPAIVTLPAAPAGKVPAVVMMHGTGSNKDEAGNGYVYASRAMAKDGIATIRIDCMGSGDSTAQYKDYNYTSANLDAKAAADYMAKQEMVDGKKIGVMGWSQGGTNALLAAAQYPDTFGAVVTWAGATDLSILFPDFDAAYATAKKDGAYELKFDWRTPLMLGEQWFKEVKETNVLSRVATIKAPILAIQGDKDTTVLPENATKIIEKAQNKNSSVYTVAGADHTFLVFSGDLAKLNQAISAGTEFFHTQFGTATVKAAA